MPSKSRSTSTSPSSTSSSSPNQPRGERRLTESYDATLAVITAVLKSSIKDGNFRNPGVNTSYPNAELFESNLNESGPTVDAYVARWLLYCAANRMFVILALVYIKRIQEYNPSFFFTKWNFHRMFAASCIVATKEIDRDAHTPDHLAQLAGLESVELMEDLEKAFIGLLDDKRTVGRRRRWDTEVDFIRQALAGARRSSVARVLRDENITQMDWFSSLLTGYWRWTSIYCMTCHLQQLFHTSESCILPLTLYVGMYRFCRNVNPILERWKYLKHPPDKPTQVSYSIRTKEYCIGEVFMTHPWRSQKRMIVGKIGPNDRFWPIPAGILLTTWFCISST